MPLESISAELQGKKQREKSQPMAISGKSMTHQSYPVWEQNSQSLYCCSVSPSVCISCTRTVRLGRSRSLQQGNQCRSWGLKAVSQQHSHSFCDWNLGSSQCPPQHIPCTAGTHIIYVLVAVFPVF